jgi:hypothetical protein
MFLNTGKLILNISILYHNFRESMSDPVIQRWERVIHKNVRSNDRIDIGNVISESGDTFTVMQGASREYNIPKSAVEGFDGSELYLSIPYTEVLKYKVS